ncbi:uncharacterized protein GlcG (DUF336 family) [Nitrospina gracilis]|nr:MULTISPECIES: heme-binding protein [Nitrospina]MCF8723232.1 uncharacterized protein GlcG (DUF336 family) [Nitrospina sp. Nb-3]
MRQRAGIFEAMGVVALMLSFALPGTGQANALPEIKALPLELAIKAGLATLDECSRNNYRVSVAVVDRGGNVKALLRHDGAGAHTPDSSFKKAYTSASLGRPTMELAELLVKVPRIQALRDMNDKILILGGGLPIKLDGQLVGGIGVGGAPGDQFDETCARAGLKAIGAE